MKDVTKKRTKAFLIDLAISAVVTAGIEQLLRKKVKSEMFHALVTPSVVLWGLEYAQLRCNGKTYGYNKMGLVLTNNDSSKVTDGQIFKRFLYRDFISTISYLKNRKSFEGMDGTILPHDSFAGTVVKENDQEIQD